MNRPPYMFRPPSASGMVTSTNNGPNGPLGSMDNVQPHHSLSGSANTGFYPNPPLGRGVQTPQQHFMAFDGFGGMVPGMPPQPGQGVDLPPARHKFSTPPVQPQMFVPNQSRSGESTPQRTTPLPYGNYPSTGQHLSPANGVPSNSPLPGNYPGHDGFIKSHSSPNAFQLNGPPSVMPGTSGSMTSGFVPRQGTPGSAVQPLLMMTPSSQSGPVPVTGMVDGVPQHFGPPPHMGLPYRGNFIPGPPPSGASSLNASPLGMPLRMPSAGSSIRGPPPSAMPPTSTPAHGAPPPMPPSSSTLSSGQQPSVMPPTGIQPRGTVPSPMMTPLGTPARLPGPPPMVSYGQPPVMGHPSGQMLPPPPHGTMQGMSSAGNSVSDSASETPSQQSSRTGSPMNQLNYDDMEGQFANPPFPGGATGAGAMTSYPSAISQAKRPIMPPTNFPGAPVPGGAMPQGQPGPSFQSQPQNAPVQGFQSNNFYGSVNAGMNRMSIQQDHSAPINLLQERNILPTTKVEMVEANLPSELKKANCSTEIMSSTINAIPNTQSLLNKSRLPFGILLHPFKDLSQLPVIQSSVIVRCRSCRTYINPFVSFVDMRRWKCNLCFRVNDLPEDFNYDPVSKTYGEPQRRPEIRSATIEFVAPVEYMLRAPQPAAYLFLLDVSFNAVETGYLKVFCDTLMEELERIPGDSRLLVGFITYDSCLHFYNLAEDLSQPHMYVVSDLEEVELPSPESLLVNLHESKDLVIDLLSKLPTWFEKNLQTGNALGSALQAAYRMMNPIGGRVTVIQTQLPTEGAGALKSREDPNERAGKNVQNLGPVTDFYKKMALDCSAQQIAVDLFMLNSQYADIATIAGVCKYSGGCLYYFPGFHTVKNKAETARFESTLRRYITRKIGFEAVMRIRCTRGLSIHAFHGNFFVRSTDLLSLPNVNPDAGYGIQVAIDETLESNYACFQAAVLYTSSKAERRIRVHTLCLPITSSLSEIQASASQLAIVGLLAKMAVDKSLSASLSDAREAMINAAIDMLSAYNATLSAGQRIGQLSSPYSLRLVPLYVLAMLKSSAFRVGTSTKLDDRVFAMEQCKNLPLRYLLQMMYPDLYPVHSLDDKKAIFKDDKVIVQPPILSLSSAHIDRHGAYLMDTGSHMYLWLGAAISDQFCKDVLGVPSFKAITDDQAGIPELDNPTSENLRHFVQYLNDQRPFAAPLIVMREDSRTRSEFLQHLIEDRTESMMSYIEFLQHLQKEVKS